MRYIGLGITILLAIFLAIGCGEDEEVPTAGTVSGTITFVGTPPEDPGEIQVSIWSVLDENGRPAGPPDHFSDPLEVITGEVQYTISGVSFGEYALAALGYEPSDSPPGTPETVLGMHGFAPPADMEPDSFAVSEEDPDATGIDIVADYSQLEVGQGHPQ